MKTIITVGLGLFFLFFHQLNGKSEETLPLSIGNFSVPTVNQIAPLVGFGQLLIGEKAFLTQISGNYTKQQNGFSNQLTPNIIYGIRDDLSAVLFFPLTINSRSHAFHSSGINDLILQGEYGFYNRKSPNDSLQATVVGNIQFPTGSSTKNPPMGAGSFTYFLGATFSYTSFYWYAFTSSGANLTTTHHGTKWGNSYLYQWGFARFIQQLSPRGWIFEVMLEFDGIYLEKNKMQGSIDPNSGGNIIFATPSLWLSSSRWIFQGGVSLPLIQNLNGHQDKIQYAINYIVAIAMQF